MADGEAVTDDEALAEPVRAAEGLGDAVRPLVLLAVEDRVLDRCDDADALPDQAADAVA